jgi:glycosyltransferase involved in cell wall biosynthesis
MSRIAIDIRPLVDRHMTGVGFALLEALRILLPHASPAREYLLFVSGSDETLSRLPELPRNPHVTLIKKNIPNKLVTLWSLFQNDALDNLIGEPFDAWWFPNWTVISTQKPFALTVHDASFVHTPHFYTRLDRALVRLAQPHRAAERAIHCITVSPHTAADIQDLWCLSPAKIHIAPLGVDPSFFGIREQPSDRSYRASYDLNRPYLLSLATHEPRKNIIGILEGYQEARRISPHALPPLVLAGVHRQHLPPHLLEHVHILGYIPSKHRAALLRGAYALLFPSFNEGFGLPVAEALSCGTPVVTSVATPPSSLFSSGVFPADPYNIADIASALLSCLRYGKDSEKQLLMHEQTRPFTWKRHVDVLEHVFQRLC